MTLYTVAADCDFDDYVNLSIRVEAPNPDAALAAGLAHFNVPTSRS